MNASDLGPPSAPPPRGRPTQPSDPKELPVFPPLGYPENATIPKSHSRSLSSSSRHANKSSPRPLSARKPSHHLEDSVSHRLASDCDKMKNAASEALLLPPVPPTVATSKPTTPEPTGGKVVRRRVFQQRKLEKNPSIGDSSPALLRRVTIAEGEPILRRRSTVGDQDPSPSPSPSPARVQRSVSVGKIPLRRVKSLEDAPRANEEKKLRRRSSIGTKEEMHLAKLEALTSLLGSMDVNPLEDTLMQLTRHVLKHHGTNAFSAEQVAGAATNVNEDSVNKGVRLEREDAVLKALRSMSEESGMDFFDVVGQILWRNRRADAVRGKQRRKEAAEDFSWVVSCTEDDVVAKDVLKALDAVFDMFEAGQRGRGMCVKAWHRVAKFVEANPVLKRRVNLTDVDRLWYAATHKPSMDPQTSIGRRAFKELLLTWCEAMGAHPWMVFVAVGSHANDAEYSENWQKLAYMH